MGTWEAITLGACIVVVVSYLHSIRAKLGEQTDLIERMLKDRHG